VPNGQLKEKVVVKPHPGGVAGAMLSLDEVASRMWAMRNDPRLRGWALRELAKAGNPTGSRDKMQALMEAFKKKVPYVSDPVQTEFVASPVQLLCLDDHGLCIPGADCDEFTVGIGGAGLSIGIPQQVVGASYKQPTDQPTHVYGQFQDDNGEWVPYDGTTNYSVGNVHEPSRTWIVDPNKGVGTAGLPGGDFVGVGRGPVPVSIIPPAPSTRTTLGPRGHASPPLSDCARGIVGGPTPQSLYDYFEDPLPGGHSLVMAPGGRAAAVSEWGALSRNGSQIGLGLVTPGDVLSYRATWNQYVIDTVGVADECAKEFTTLSTNETDASTKAWLIAYAKTVQTQADSILSMWNLYANTESSFIVLEGASILRSFQETVLAAGQVRFNITSGPLPCVLTYVSSSGQVVQAAPAADPSVQQQVIARIEGLKILADGALQILVGTAGNSLVAVGSATQWAAQQVGNVTAALATPGPWIALTAVAGAVIVYELWK
jgi:hypothetical protein